MAHTVFSMASPGPRVEGLPGQQPGAAADQTPRERIMPLEQQFGSAMHGMAVRLLDVDDSDHAAGVILQGALGMARGPDLSDTLRDESRRRAHVISAW